MILVGRVEKLGSVASAQNSQHAEDIHDNSVERCVQMARPSCILLTRVPVKHNISGLQPCRLLPCAGITQYKSVRLSATSTMHPKLAEVPWFYLQAVRMPTLFLMSSCSAARMMARLPVTCSLMAEMKASSFNPDISSVTTPPLRGQKHHQGTSQVCLGQFTRHPKGEEHVCT